MACGLADLQSREQSTQAHVVSTSIQLGGRGCLQVALYDIDIDMYKVLIPGVLSLKVQ